VLERVRPLVGEALHVLEAEAGDAAVAALVQQREPIRARMPVADVEGDVVALGEAPAEAAIDFFVCPGAGDERAREDRCPGARDALLLR
jgi:hypothetical protein